ncbi:MAG: type II toxin-antitoxin system HicA family toxin [Promethearchaeota archaeon]
MPVISGEETVKAFLKLGYRVVRQRGSHVRLRHESNPDRKPLTIPLHKELKVGLLNRLISDANVKKSDFIKLL